MWEIGTREACTAIRDELEGWGAEQPEKGTMPKPGAAVGRESDGSAGRAKRINGQRVK